MSTNGLIDKETVSLSFSLSLTHAYTHTHTYTHTRIHTYTHTYTHTHTHTHTYTNAMQYYSAMREKEILIFATTWMELEGIKFIEIRPMGKDKYCIASPMCGINFF